MRKIDITVLQRTKRTKKQVEWWCLCMFLASVAESNLLCYPLIVEYGDRPDFVLNMCGTFIGIEITEAVPEDWAHAVAISKDKAYARAMHCQKFLPGEPRRSKIEIERMASGDICGNGWICDEAEFEWCKAMAYRVEEKCKDLSKIGFRKFNNNWLIIYDNWPLPNIDEEKSSNLFHKWLTNPQLYLPFDTIFVERPENIWEFTLISYSSFLIKAP